MSAAAFLYAFPFSSLVVMRSSFVRFSSVLFHTSSPARARRAAQQATTARSLHTTTIQRSAMTSALLNAVVTSPSAFSAQPPDAKEKAHHNKNGVGFVNPWDSYKDWQPWSILMAMAKLRFSGKWNSPDTTPPTVPVRRPDFLKTRQTSKLRATWLGHACYYVEFPGGFRVLFDPVFTARCSPFSFMGPKRYTEMPCQIEDIPYIDAVIISHSHYDHLSYPTVLKIAEKYKNAHFFVPLGNKAWFDKIGVKNATELDWWEEKTVTLSTQYKDIPKVEDSGSETSPAPKQEDIVATIGSLPCQHTSARTPFDKAHTLWSSWSVVSGGKKVWFGGDTGYVKPSTSSILYGLHQLTPKT